MNVQEINKGNLLIAKIMGYETFASGVVQWKDGDRVRAAKGEDVLKYRESWDALIPAFNQCVTIFIENKGFEDVEDERKWLALFALKSTPAISGVTQQLEITSAWTKIVDFIKWYTTYKTRKL